MPIWNYGQIIPWRTHPSQLIETSNYATSTVIAPLTEIQNDEICEGVPNDRNEGVRILRNTKQRSPHNQACLFPPGNKKWDLSTLFRQIRPTSKSATFWEKRKLLFSFYRWGGGDVSCAEASWDKPLAEFIDHRSIGVKRSTATRRANINSHVCLPACVTELSNTILWPLVTISQLVRKVFSMFR